MKGINHQNKYCITLKHFRRNHLNAYQVIDLMLLQLILRRYRIMLYIILEAVYYNGYFTLQQ